MVKNLISRFCTNPFGGPPPPDLLPKQGKKHANGAENMLYVPWMVILGGHNIRKTTFKNFDF